MTLVRAWRRHLYGGLAGVALVPAALLAALFTFAFAGGLAPLGVLGQALSGPPAPSPPGSAGTAALARAARPLSPAALAALSAAAAAPVSAPTTAEAHRVGAPVRSRGTTAPATRPVTATNRPTRAGGRAGGGGEPPPPRQPTVVDQMVGAGTAVTSQLPGPAGPLATATLQAAGSTADQIVPPGSPTLP